MPAVKMYEDTRGRCPFEKWFNGLSSKPANQVIIALDGIEGGGTGGLKSLGKGVHEWRIDTGPGLRIYLGKDGDRLVVLLGGGTKRRQSTDIAKAQERWRDYLTRRKARER